MTTTAQQPQGMSPERFFELFILELSHSPGLQGYYKFLGGKNRLPFRKNYFMQRLKYIAKYAGEKQNTVWDIGCGYGTTAIFLALNGYTVHGTTLESYFDEIQKRIKFWSAYGNVSSFTFSYENIFDERQTATMVDRIIVQDTLHHIEPISSGLNIISRSLRSKGKIIVIEENGNNILQRTMLYFRRGNNRIISMYDEILRKEILIGNENIRPLSAWSELFKQQHCIIENVEYIRLFLPFFWNVIPHHRLERLEKRLFVTNTILREYFYFGMNFLIGKENG
ncbi:MAG: methyltransferase [Bacteriovoracaceae bacterium]